MKEQEFISLLQSHPECLFDEKKFRAILMEKADENRILIYEVKNCM